MKGLVQDCIASEQQSWDESPMPPISSSSAFPGMPFPPGHSVSHSRHNERGPQGSDLTVRPELQKA